MQKSEEAGYNSQMMVREEGGYDEDEGQLLADKEALENKTDDDCREDILNYIECHDANKYRKKIKGFHIPFNIRDKLKTQDEDLSKYKFKSKLSPEEIKRLAQEAKNKRAQDRVMKEREEKEKY